MNARTLGERRGARPCTRLRRAQVGPPLHMAIWYGRTAMAEGVVARGAKVDLQDSHGARVSNVGVREVQFGPPRHHPLRHRRVRVRYGHVQGPPHLRAA